ncbi:MULTISPECIES: GntP family permease [unclassified Halomonas]|uniref:GntP family permease n=1 Tax=unclassified Halomonas TaxID=2609666 RepID=UPI0021E36E7C|nr:MULTISPECIES: GntP family permease [unclassified Halomonas]UYG00890.1 GntP family permease [Halomonas sp. GD1P12]WNL38046.1 GntP family permease [Halomonas sp. PAMB 3232]WNL41372.1 GntP family permease [Halomonas sp. PAMB 3264]
MDGWTQTMSAGPLLGIATAAVLLLLLLIIRFKVHAFLALISVSFLTALVTGIPYDAIVPTLVQSFGGTLGAVALLVGLGAMLGKLVEHSGGARVLADRMITLFGEQRAPLALGVASLLMGFPIFFDAGLIVMLPIIFAVGRRLGGPILLYAMPAAAAFSVMHVFLPPHPGPVTAAELYDANLGLLMLTGVVIAFPLWWISGYMWGQFVAKRHPFPLDKALFGEVKDDEVTHPPAVGTVIFMLLLPLLLIFMNTGLDFLRSLGAVDSDQGWFQLMRALGSTPVALLISALVAMLVLGRRRGVEGNALEKVLDSSLGPICSVVLITGAGGMFGGVLRASGIGDALSDSLGDLGFSVIVAAYLIAVILRLAQGSATVALVTAAGLMAPAVAGADFSAMQIVAITLATAAGSVFAGHVNDSGFWLVGRLLGMDVKTTLKTWTVQQALESLVGFVFAYVIFVLF